MSPLFNGTDQDEGSSVRKGGGAAQIDFDTFIFGTETKVKKLPKLQIAMPIRRGVFSGALSKSITYIARVQERREVARF